MPGRRRRGAIYASIAQFHRNLDGKGKTAAALGVYPPPVNLSRVDLAERKRTDGDLFYLVRNGIRNTAMPGWQFTDQQMWQLVIYVRQLSLTATTEAEPPAEYQTLTNAHYVGSAV